jgi:hypothetical protein
MFAEGWACCDVVQLVTGKAFVMAQVRHVRAWWVGLLVVVVGLALLLPLVEGPADGKVFPGEGVEGPPLRYKVNSNGTITDRNTGLMWEMKLAETDQPCTAAAQRDRSVNCVNNTYSWISGSPIAEHALFTDFLATLNNRCHDDERIRCTRDSDCGQRRRCGFAGHRDWRIPNIKELHSIVDYGVFNPAIDPDFGPTDSTPYWSSTLVAPRTTEGDGAWGADFSTGIVLPLPIILPLPGRAVRGGG